MDPLSLSVRDSGESNENANRRWPLIMSSVLVQLIAGSVYAMGAWQDTLRDVLGIAMGDVSAISAATFAGSLAAMLAGFLFDRLGPRATVASGGALCTSGYLVICFVVRFGGNLTPITKTIWAAFGSLMTGFSSVSLLDNPVCMACSISFPEDKAKIVGYLKACLATAAGLWVILWVHVFRAPHGIGLEAYLMFAAISSLCCTMLSLFGMKVMPTGDCRKAFDRADNRRLITGIFLLVALSLYNVTISFLFSRSIITPTILVGITGVALAMVPFIVVPCLPDTVPNPVGAVLAPSTGVAEGAHAGLTFREAVLGLDFWLMWILQSAVFGAGFTTNSNLALILESASSSSATGLGVALFALTSSLSRIVVGILSDRYAHKVSRFLWLISIATCGMISQLLMSHMSLGSIMPGVLLTGLSFGAFFTVIVPVVLEMYGRKQFGMIMSAQLASQAVVALSMSLIVLPAVYRQASNGRNVCIGAPCYRFSFVLLAALQALGLMAALLLKYRNKSSTPLSRYMTRSPST